MPAAARSSGCISYRLAEFGSPASRPRSIPSSPAASIAVAARYGLHEPSTVRSSIRPASGIRSICVRLL